MRKTNSARSVQQLKQLMDGIDKGLEVQVRKLAALTTEYNKAAVHFSALHCKGVNKASKELIKTAQQVQKLAKEFT